KKVAELAQERNTLNKEVQELIATAKAERENRDAKNQSIAELKKQRDAELKKVEEIQLQIDEQRSKLRDSDEATSQRGGPSARALEREIRELDWKLQTTRMKLDEERSIVDQISHLEEQLSKVREIEGLSKGMKDLRRGMRQARGSFRAINSELRGCSRESRQHHKNMIQNFKSADAKRKDADIVHNNFLSIKEQADEAHKEYISLVKEIRSLNQTIMRSRAETFEKERKAAKARIAEQAEESLSKFREGKKLSFDEFRTLVDRGLI
ncbi:MAG: coiled-coil protein, partial [Candidatus Hodarchaeales archaeon]